MHSKIRTFFPNTIIHWNLLPQNIVLCPTVNTLREQLTPTVNLYFLFSYMFSVQYSVFQHIGLMHEQYQFCPCPWCYEDMSLVLPGLNSIISFVDICLLIA